MSLSLFMHKKALKNVCVKNLTKLNVAKQSFAFKKMEESLLGEIPELNPFQILENRVRAEKKLEFLQIYNNNEMFYKKYISFLTKSIEQKDKEIEQLKNKYNFFLETKTDLNK